MKFSGNRAYPRAPLRGSEPKESIFTEVSEICEFQIIFSKARIVTTFKNFAVLTTTKQNVMSQF